MSSIKFSNTVMITDLETFSTIVPMKTHDGLSVENKQFEDLIWLTITHDFLLWLELTFYLDTAELEIYKEKTINLLKRIMANGKGPILEGGGGQNRVLGPQFKHILYELVLRLQNIIEFRKNTYLTFTI